MRLLLLSALLLGTASCAWPQQQGAYGPSAAAALQAGPPAAAAPAASPPHPVAAVAAAPTPVAALYTPLPILNPGTVAQGVVTHLFGPDLPIPSLGPPPAGRLTLSNFTYPLADLEAIVTPYPDCELHAGIVPRDFKVPLDGTWVIRAPPGSDVCWRRQLPAAPPQAGAPAAPSWAKWNRAFTASGRFVDSRL